MDCSHERHRVRATLAVDMNSVGGYRPVYSSSDVLFYSVEAMSLPFLEPTGFHFSLLVRILFDFVLSHSHSTLCHALFSLDFRPYLARNLRTPLSPLGGDRPVNTPTHYTVPTPSSLGHGRTIYNITSYCVVFLWSRLQEL